MPTGRRFFMARTTSRSLNTLLPLTSISPTFTFGPFVHLEDHFEGRRRDLAKFGLDGRELTAALGEKFLQHVRGALHLARIVLRFDGEADLSFLEPVQDFRDCNGLRAFVLDRADDAALGQKEANDPAVRPAFLLQTDVVEPARVPQRHEVAMERFFVVFVALPGDDQRTQCVLRNTAGPAEFNIGNYIRIRWRDRLAVASGGRSNGVCFGFAGAGFAGAGSCDCGTVSNGISARRLRLGRSRLSSVEP